MSSKSEFQHVDTAWILVAGSAYGLSDKLVNTSKQLGRALADAGFGLITGGWQGVDHLTARAFAESVKEANGRLLERLSQYMEIGSTPDFPGGRYVTCATERAAWELSVQRAQAIIVIGGIGGTYETGIIGRRQGKPVLPLADTRDHGHTDSYRLYFEIHQSWAKQPVQGLTLDEFSDLAGPAPEVVRDCLALLDRLFGLQPNKVNQDGQRRSHGVAVVELWREKLNFLLQQEPIVVDAAQKFSLCKQIEEAKVKLQEAETELK